MSNLHIRENLRIQTLRLNVRVLQTFGVLLDNSLTLSRHGRLSRRGILYLIIFIHIQLIFGSVMELILSSGDSHQTFESLGYILSYVKGAMQLFALIFSGQEFIHLIKRAEVNFMMNGKLLGNMKIIFDKYVQTANRLACFMWVTFVLTLSSVFFELVPTFNVSTENYSTQFDGQVMGRRKTAYKVWTPFQKLDSRYLKADIIYEMLSVTIFFLVFTTINLLTLMLIVFFAGHFNLLAESIENLTVKMDDATSTGTSLISLVYLTEQFSEVSASV